MIPKDKFDVTAVEQLAHMETAQIIPLLPQMLEWIQDMNWPVAEPMVEVLLQYPTELTSLVEQVLLGDDDMWIYWCLQKIVPRLPFFSKLALMESVERIATLTVTSSNEHNVEAAKKALLSFEP